MDHLEAWRKGIGRKNPHPSAVPTNAERQRLLEVNHAAVRFYRRELFRARGAWAWKYLERSGASDVLQPTSAWLAGYAPDARSRLVDHLQSQRFDLDTIRRGGLGVQDAGGRLVDRFRDQLMFPARDDLLAVVGFVGLRKGSGGVYYTRSPQTQIHRRSRSLIGIAEQHDLFQAGAVPVLVSNPLDALAIERTSRLNARQWAAIPLSDTLLSAEQVRTLRAYAQADTVIVVLPDNGRAKARAEYLSDLPRAFRHVQAVELSTGHTPATLWRAGGERRLHHSLLDARPLSDYVARPGPPSRRYVREQFTEVEIDQPPTPGL
ncbi:hypothetical protein HPO96_35145 [Kribbella sandramycini]|uniref:DNA primase n=1 Tax=Kribbella sandramycini TaxID=60450 RepID=A0A7Y4P2L1_9ACTN|nr:hypothetical protein [Kribbella sandramycini]MBB6566711.1 DNA primase [Kribbella sandramycini]NOL45497.1 hypothetical protein [Kribbella sandramycini]